MCEHMTVQVCACVESHSTLHMCTWTMMHDFNLWQLARLVACRRSNILLKGWFWSLTRSKTKYCIVSCIWSVTYCTIQMNRCSVQSNPTKCKWPQPAILHIPGGLWSRKSGLKWRSKAKLPFSLHPSMTESAKVNSVYVRVDGIYLD